MAICTSRGSSVPGPVPSVRPPPGMVMLTVNLAGLVDGHVTRSAVTVRSVTAREVIGETARSSNVAVPLVKSKRSRLIRHAGGPGAATLGGFVGEAGVGALAAGAPA